jgi:death on curing protein
MAAAYTAGIICNQPFLDGNKRAGFLVGILFLEMNVHHFTPNRPSFPRSAPT